MRAFALAETDVNGNILLNANGVAVPKLTSFSTQGQTQVETGAGNDTVQYNVNAPVAIDGGAGFDKVVVLGTEFPDNFVITEKGIFGAGVNIRFNNIEVVEVDGLEGDDDFFVLSTPFGVSTRLIGGLGSDAFSVGGDVGDTIVTQELEGRSGVINHQVTSTDPDYNNLLAPGVDLNVTSTQQGVVVINDGGDVSVREVGAPNVDSYTVSLDPSAIANADDNTIIYVTVSAALSPLEEATNGDGRGLGDSILVATNPNNFRRSVYIYGQLNNNEPNRAVVLTFNKSNWNQAQTIYVQAVDDNRPEGKRVVTISHSVAVTTTNTADKARFDQAKVRNVEVNVLDDDQPGLVITESNLNTQVLEGNATQGITDSYDIQLTKAPMGSVTVKLDYNAHIAVTSSDLRFNAANRTITFNTSNWNQKVTLNVSAIDDSIREDALLSLITHSIDKSLTSRDTAFDSIVELLDVKVFDNETQSVIVTESNGSTLVSKDGTLTDTYSVRLTKAPVAGTTVTITPVADGQTTTSPTPLTFTSQNWWIPQTVTVQGNPNFTPAPGSEAQSTKEFAAQPHLLNNIQGPLSIIGGSVGPRTWACGLRNTSAHRPLSIIGGSVGPRALNNAILLPQEQNTGLLEIGTQPPEDEQIDTLNIFDDSSREDKTGVLSSDRLTGLGMAGDLVFSQPGLGEPSVIPGGISYNTIEVFNLLLGEGNDKLNITGTLNTSAKHGGITTVHGGGNSYIANSNTVVGGDTITITGGGGASSPLVVYGDTSQDGLWYAGNPAVANRTDNILLGNKLFDQVGTADDTFRFARANPYVRNGNDVIDASALFAGVPSSALPSIGVTIYGGAGDDKIIGSQAGDRIAGGSGNDDISGQGGDDIIYGDSGLIVDPITRTLLVPTQEANPNPQLTPQDKLIAGKDKIAGNAGDDIIFGDHGIVIQDVPPSNDNLFNLVRLPDGSIRPAIIGAVGVDPLVADINEKLLTVGKVDRIETAAPTNGDDDVIDGDAGNDRILGGQGSDTINGGSDNNIVLGDLGLIDYVNRDSDRTDIDEISSTVTAGDAAIGGDDTITTEAGEDIILGGTGSDNIQAGEGRNLVIGDNGRILAANANTPRFGQQPLTLGSIETTAYDIGGADTITTGSGDDIVLGGDAGDTITASDLNNLVADDDNIVFGDDGRIVYDADGNSADIDSIVSTSTTVGGGADTVNTGNGVDFIIGGRFGDVINGRNGKNIVIGDSGQIQSHTSDTVQQFAGQPMTVGRIETTEPTDGGNDTITTGNNEDIVLGGAADDTITTNAANDIVLGDNGFVDYVQNDSNPADIDIIRTTNPNAGGKDTITAGAGNDIVFGGTADDTISGNEGNDLIFGDHGPVVGEIDANLLPLSLNQAQTAPNVRPVHPFTWTSIDTQNTDGGGSDLIRGNEGDDVILGGQAGDRITGGSGNDDIIGGHNVAGGHDGNDSIDAGAGNDWVAGDNADILRTGDDNSVRMRVLSGTNIYDAQGNPLVTGTAQANPTGDIERYIQLFDHSFTPAANTSGDDLIAGGADDDVIFGQLGNDVIQGDGSAINDSGNITIDVRGTQRSVEDFAGAGTDGDDYIEGNGGNDTIFGNLGQDDIVGGSSDQYSLTTPEQRPDGSDTIFGGAGTDLARNNYGDITGDCDCEGDNPGHGRDADNIMGDNANIFRLVGINGTASNPSTFLTFNYDTYDPTLKIVPRAYQFLDYTQGVGSAAGYGAADLVHGESGDDTIHGMAGDDVLFGEGQDDDIYGGTGNDRIYGGTGTDGILGDDGKIYTSRNGSTEPLNNLNTAIAQQLIETPGPFTGAVVNVTGELHKIVDLVAFDAGGNDVIYGGLGCDFLHGGAGDDAISGAEAQIAYYTTVPQTITALGYDPANPLGYDPVTRKFAAYDANNPRTKIPNFLLNFDAYIVDETTGAPIQVNGALIKVDDGKDRIFGDTGNDWLVGGTANDRIFGGFGDDYLNADDNLETNGGLNNQPDAPQFADADFAFGGAGLDVLIANTGADRLFDWLGEFNTFIVPFSAFGSPTVNRLPSPNIVQFLLDLGKGEGADPTIFEPNGELGLVQNSDPQWQDQNGAPSDPQPGNIGGVQRDTQGGKEDPTDPGSCGCDCETTPPLIRIEKVVNAVNPNQPTVFEDANSTLTAPNLNIGTPVTWTYQVSNLGTQSLTAQSIRDNAGTTNTSDDFTPVFVSGDTNNNQKLDPGEIWLYTSASVITHNAIAGQYTNIATVTALNSEGLVATDDDPATYFGTAQGITIKKAINAVNPNNPTVAEEADTQPGVNLTVGSSVVWTYRVSNTSGAAVTITEIRDDAGTPTNTSDDFTPIRISGDTNNNNLLDVNEVWLYTSIGTVAGNYKVIEDQYTNVARVTATGSGKTYKDDDQANYFGIIGSVNAIAIKKFVNGADADTAPGLNLSVGTPVTWTYQVSNQGNTPLTITSIRDDRGTLNNTSDDFTPVFSGGDTNNNNLLDVGEVWNYTSVGTVAGNDKAVAGQYTNMVKVTATNSAQQSFTDDDPANYFGVSAAQPIISITKAINAVDYKNPTPYEDANSTPGPILAVGTPITWTYQVRNTGNAAATITSLRDDSGTVSNLTDDFTPAPILTAGFNTGDINKNNLLDTGEVWYYTSAGVRTYTAVAGQYTNTATITARNPITNTVFTAQDKASYFGTGTPTNQPIRIVKAVNVVNPNSPTAAEDANNPNNPVYLNVGSTVTWTYQVFNTGNSALALSRTTGIVDNAGTFTNTADDFNPTYVSGDSNNNQRIEKNEVWLYRATGIVREGLYTNIAIATATTTSGTIITYKDDDLASYFGVKSLVRIEKAVNGIDADDPNNPVYVNPGSNVTWTYQVFNDGNVALTVNSVKDDGGTPSDPINDFSPSPVLQPNTTFNAGDINRDGLLDTNEVWLYQATGTAVEGLYTNVAKVTATAANTQQIVSDDDPASYFGTRLGIRIKKAINAQNPLNPNRFEDADNAPGVVLAIGAPITWTYQVFNTGNIAFDMLGVQDDAGTVNITSDDFDPLPVNDSNGFNIGDRNFNNLLDPNEIWLFTSNPIGYQAVAGQYTNTATAIGSSKGLIISAQDKANYFGTSYVNGRPQIEIVKAVNAVNPNNPTVTEDANNPNNPVNLLAGSTVTWTYQVFNRGTTAISNVIVRDDAGTANPSDDFTAQYLSGDTNNNNLLDTNEVWLYRSSGNDKVAAGAYTNMGYVQGTDTATNTIIMDNDPANYFGVNPRVRIEKAFNAVDPNKPTSTEDADTKPGAYRLVGLPLTWTYQLFNDGNVALQVTTIRDDRGTVTNTSDDFTPQAVLQNGFNIGDRDRDGLLDTDEVWLYTSVGTIAANDKVIAGQYTNIGTVTAKDTIFQTTTTSSDQVNIYGLTKAQGLTPGFWKNNADNKNAVAWPRDNANQLIYSPFQTLESVFDIPDNLGLDNVTLVDALDLGGGGVNALLRHAVAALLGATHPYITYPLTPRQVIDQVNAALASGNATTINNLKNQLDTYNNYEATLDQQGNVTVPLP